MTKRSRYNEDTKVKDTAVFLLMPIVAWCMLAGLVAVMVWVTGG